MNRRFPKTRRLAYCYATLPLHRQRSIRQRAALDELDEQIRRSETSALRNKFAIIALVAGALLIGLTAIASANPIEIHASSWGGRPAEAQQNAGRFWHTSKVASAKVNRSNPFPQDEEAKAMETATFGSGCFWCGEAVFEEMKGVESVVSGYAGGRIPNPTYQQVCTGQTGHAEVFQIKFDPEVVSFDELLEVFWKTHDPTTLNRQGADVGTQYRSVIFYHDDVQKEIAEKYKKKLNEAGAFDDPIVTEISPLTKFYPAEDYHQDYYAKNPGQGYCRAVISPKMKKFRIIFKEKLKDK